MDELDILPPILIIIMAAAYRQYLRNERKRWQTSRKPSVLTDRNAVGPKISKYISDRMSGKT